MAHKIDISMPQDLLLQSGYSLRVTAVDVTNGALVSGVKVGTVVITADGGSVSGQGNLEYGQWFLVPGPGA